MAIICIISGVLQLLTLMTITGILISFAALFNLLELILLAANPICFYLIRQTGYLLTYSIQLAILRIQQVSIKMMNPGFDNQTDQNSIVETIDPLPLEMDLNSEELPRQETDFKDVNFNKKENEDLTPETFEIDSETSEETHETSKILDTTEEASKISNITFDISNGNPKNLNESTNYVSTSVLEDK